ncbi:hypothetical protein PLICRDRAFT_180174 [Plicaturopsis crispa FD-325 SS-3]|uniref:Uncharacterized protein n=1 Tax=Plicaturopsis crispa FD-325 SS-3 TaxID=944288 RepID=A0A0C9SKJ4_PLICR|nr:hypothetical protein PLICRDRAFT_180174 [Plicaturopsis crispa FD-325 SS-3]
MPSFLHFNALDAATSSRTPLRRVIALDTDNTVTDSDSVVSTAALSTTSNATTVWVGIGSTAGRVLQALGNLQLRALDNVIIRMKLSAAENLVFKQLRTAGEVPPTLGPVWDDLIELSRPVYSPRITCRAMHLIRLQIECRQTAHFIKALQKRTYDEIYSFVLGYSSYSLGKNDVDIDSLHLGMQDEFVDFLWDFAQQDELVFWFNLRIGLLDTCLNDKRYWDHRSKPFLARYSAIFAHCTNNYPGAREAIAAHPVSLLWPLGARLFPAERRRFAYICSGRRKAWPRVNHETIRWRLQHLRPGIDDSARTIEACIDCLELRRDIYPDDIRELANRAITLFLHYGTAAALHWHRKIVKDVLDFLRAPEEPVYQQEIPESTPEPSSPRPSSKMPALAIPRPESPPLQNQKDRNTRGPGQLHRLFSAGDARRGTRVSDEG